MKSWLENAREASEMTPEDCASTLKCSRATYMSRENNPGSLNLVEIGRLRGKFNDRSNKIMKTALLDIFT